MIPQYKDVRGFEGHYIIYYNGTVESVERKVLKSNGNIHYTQKRKELKPYLSNGYLAVVLCKDGIKYHRYIHILIGQCFIEGEKPGLVINHKDKNRFNNDPPNLEWCTQKYNSEHGQGKAVIQIKDNVEINEFFTLTIAEEVTGIDKTSIGRVCNGKRKNAGGYKWIYSNK